MRKKISKLLIRLLIVQVTSNLQRRIDGLQPLGQGFTQAYRFNRYNPLSYIVIAVITIVGILMYGFVGFWKELNCSNPFKWN